MANLAEIKVMTSNALRGVFAASNQPVAAQALIDFLATPDSVRVFKAKGFKPG